MMLPQSLAKVTNDAQLYLLNAFHATLNWVSDRSEYLISSNCAHSCILVRPIPMLVIMIFKVCTTQSIFKTKLEN